MTRKRLETPSPMRGGAPTQGKGRSERRMVPVSVIDADWIKEQAMRRGETMGEFVSHLRKMYEMPKFL